MRFDVGMVCFFKVMLVFCFECGFSLARQKVISHTEHLLYSGTPKNVILFINDLVHLNSTLTQVERVLPNTFVIMGLLAHISQPLVPGRLVFLQYQHAG